MSEPKTAIRCRKPEGRCVCGEIAPLTLRHQLLILQHPQEQDAALGTACVTQALFANATFRIGLSWPNLGKALGRPADPKKWGVLYLGAKAEADLKAPLTVVDRQGEPLPEQRALLADLEGIVVLDGSWSQAKALWWRNAWLLKLRRLVLQPQAPSRYGKLRREPRRESLSTLEAAALALSVVERNPDVFARGVAAMDQMLARYRSPQQGTPEPV